MKKLFFLITLSLLLVSMAWGQTYLIQEGFATTSLPTGWSGDLYFNASANIGNLTGANGAGFNANNKYLQLPALSNVGVLTFWMKGSAATSQISMKVQKSVGGGAFTDIATYPKPHSTTAAKYTINVNDSNSNIVLKFLAYDRSGNSLYIDDIEVTQNSASPTITVSPSALTDFGYVFGSSTSTSQSYTLSAANLTPASGNITITGSTNYEVSTDNSSFGASKTVAYSSATLANTTIYVRLKTGLAIGTYNSQTVSNAGGGATTKNVTCSGEVTTPPAPSAPTATAATSVAANSFTATWGAASGATGYRLDVYTKTAGTNATDLFISEYYEGSSGTNKAIEIYNGTGSTVDLTAYSLRKQANGANAFGGDLPLTGTLANGSVYIVAHSSSSAAILDLADQTFGGSPVDFNGNDAVALYKSGVQIDVVGIVDQVAPWGENMTLVRKATVNSPTTSFSFNDWDTTTPEVTTNLKSHTMSGGSTKTFVSGYNNKDVSNVTTYDITGLDPSTTYYYVVRAYNTYGTSVSSDEITATTTSAPAYDYPTGTGVPVTGGATITFTQGYANNSEGTPTPVPNANFTPNVQLVVTLIGAGPWNITVATEDDWVVYRRGSTWTSFANSGSSVSFEVTATKDEVIEIKTGNGDNPLPVVLSSFTAVLNAQNYVNIMWVTQTETSLTGFYVYRSDDNDVANAAQISALINPTNTSQQQVYLFTDDTLTEAGTYYYWLQIAEMDGTSAFSHPTVIYFDNTSQPGTPPPPSVTELKKIYPNPFNPTATISYGLAKAADVTINIYNARGQIVRTFNEGTKAADYHRLVWNGKDNNGSDCSTGIYYINMQAGKDSFTRKAVLMK
ncbi:hypothetical protein MASR2M64_12800 [Candidatus Cloacimonadota bacterium]